MTIVRQINWAPYFLGLGIGTAAVLLWAVFSRIYSRMRRRDVLEREPLPGEGDYPETAIGEPTQICAGAGLFEIEKEITLVHTNEIIV